MTILLFLFGDHYMTEQSLNEFLGVPVEESTEEFKRLAIRDLESLIEQIKDGTIINMYGRDSWPRHTTITFKYNRHTDDYKSDFNAPLDKLKIEAGLAKKLLEFVDLQGFGVDVVEETIKEKETVNPFKKFGFTLGHNGIETCKTIDMVIKIKLDNTLRDNLSLVPDGVYPPKE